jgi:hypothetical protein
MWGERREAVSGAAEMVRAGRWLGWTFLVVLAASAAQAECRVTGIVISTKSETKAEPAANQFRMRVVDSPWSWQVGTSMPVTSSAPVKLKPGEAVEVLCNFAKSTRNGRFWGKASRLEAPPAPAQSLAQSEGPAS